MIHVHARPETVRFGRLPGAGAEPVAVVEDGGTVVFDTVSHEGMLPDQGSDPRAFFTALGIPAAAVLPDVVELAAAGLPHDAATDGPHLVVGPVAVAGARPGDVLRVETVALERRCDFGIVSNRHGRGVLAGELPRPGPDSTVAAVVSRLATVDPGGTRGRLHGPAGGAVSFPLRPFLGLVGVAPAEPAERGSRAPGPFGGNLDIRHLVEGSSLLLPVLADGALLYVGDPHFAQGNGEVALTAFEAPLRATLRLNIERGPTARALSAAMAHPWVETEEHLIPIGLGETLDAAMAAGVRHALAVVEALTGLDEGTALAYLSAAADFEVSQAVNGIRGVHCLLRRADLADATAPGTALGTTQDPPPPRCATVGSGGD